MARCFRRVAAQTNTGTGTETEESLARAPLVPGHRRCHEASPRLQPASVVMLSLGEPIGICTASVPDGLPLPVYISAADKLPDEDAHI